MKILLNENCRTELVEEGFWQMYTITENDAVVFIGWKLFDVALSKLSEDDIEKVCMNYFTEHGGVESFPTLEDLNDYTHELVIECHSSDNEMWFVEFGDERLQEVVLGKVLGDVEKWNLEAIEISWFDTGNGEPQITVYGGISEQVNFIDFNSHKIEKIASNVDILSQIIGTKLTLKEGNFYIGQYVELGASEGVIYKNYFAFEHPELFDENEVVYIPENGFPNSEFEWVVSDNRVQGYEVDCQVYTRQDLIDLCDGDIDLAEALFNEVSWAFPTTVIDEWERNGEIEEIQEFIKERKGNLL